VPIRLRDYTPNEFDAIWHLDQVCFAEGIAYSRDEMRMYLALRSSFCILAELDGKIAGFTVVDSRPPRPGYIVTIDVAPEARRLGVASALLAETEQRLRQQGSPGIRLEVAVNNQAAIGFYKRHGFNEIGVKPGYYNGQLDALSMQKELAAN
jgi:[ribosomal protein S18]-alanine N-acetyltransferase